MAEGSTPAGWYEAQGDPPGTQRWWDGTQWVGEPQPVPSAPMPDVGSAPTPPEASSMPLLPGAGSPPQDGAPLLPGSGSDSFGSSSGFPGAPMPAPAGQAVGLYPEESQATLALVLSIVGFFCGITAPFGLWFGWKERTAIDAGRRNPANRGQAIAAIVIGAITTAIAILIVAFFLLIVVAASASSAAPIGL